ncbi:MAG: phosphatidylserine/phosphatidylglycerophosphate/cardiolipin synthase family protein [Chlamydiales bacterium]|nr:phosphatidylserine/phosphatidylglycerophosphate/cardiolipin synthase family protein [Chlamydiales bacterium]
MKHSLRVSFFLLAFGLFFLYVTFDSVSPRLPTASEPICLYSNQYPKDLQLTLLEAIHRAQKSIHLVMFGLTDLSILSALAHQANRGVNVDIYYDPKGSSRLDLLLKQAKTYPVNSKGLMHQKIMIIDNTMIFIGSANMTTASLRMHDNLVIGCIHPELAAFLQKKTPYSSGYMTTLAGKQKLEIWLLPDSHGHALSDLQKKIRSAHSSIRIALFTWTHPTLLEEVIAAHQRGVEVSVIIDMHSALGASAKGVQQMKEEGVPIFVSQGIQLMHHKFLWIDEETLLTGSANWTKSAFHKNSDCFIALNPLNQEQKKFMNKLWNQLRAKTKPLSK